MADILFTIEKYVIVMNFLVFLLMAPHARMALSSFVSVTFLLLMNAIMFWCEIYLKQLYGSFPDIVRHTWFFVFGALELVCIAFIYRFHIMFGIQPSTTSKSIVNSFNLLLICQAVAHFDRFIFKTEVILNFYSLLIPAINISIAIITVITMLKLYFDKYSNKLQGAN